MHDAHVPCEGVVARERLLFRAQVAAYLLLLRVVDRVLVSREIVGAGEDRVARLACGRIDPLALVGASLGVPHQAIAHQGVRPWSGLAVSLTLVFLQFGWRFEAM